jgi:hypothetical protein
MVRKIADSGRPVVNSNMRRMSGALINHCIYRTHFVQSSVNIIHVVEGKETYEDAAPRPASEFCPDGRLAQVGRHGEVRYRSH